MFRFETLELWKLATEYVDIIYRITKGFPKEELFGLTSQLRRASVSISTNIAEGSGAVSTRDYKNYLDIAVKSALETTSLLYVVARQRYISEEVRGELYRDAELIIRKTRAFKASLDKQLAISTKQ